MRSIILFCLFSISISYVHSQSDILNVFGRTDQKDIHPRLRSSHCYNEGKLCYFNEYFRNGYPSKKIDFINGKYIQYSYNEKNLILNTVETQFINSDTSQKRNVISSLYFYNSKDMIDSILIYRNDSIYISTIYNYDSLNRLSLSSTFDQERKNIWNEKYSYNVNFEGELLVEISSQYKPTTNYTIVLDELGRIVSKIYNKFYRETIVYDKNGNIKVKQRIFQDYIDAEIYYYSQYLEKVEYYSSNKGLTNEFYYHYNKKGLLSHIKVNVPGKEKQKIATVYEYHYW